MSLDEICQPTDLPFPGVEMDDDPWADYQTTDPRPWVDRNGNRHSYRTKKFTTPQKYLDAGCAWEPRDRASRLYKDVK